MKELPSYAELVDAVKRRFLDARTVALVGSAAYRSAQEIGDIDLLVLSDSIPEGDAVEECQAVAGWTLDIVAYNSLHFIVLAERPDLLLYSGRDVRKFVRGILLVDDGIGATSIARCRLSRPSVDVLGHVLEISRLICRDNSFSRHSFSYFQALENIIFLRMNSTIESRYTKHKYLLRDAYDSDHGSFARLLEVSAEALMGKSNWPDMVGEFHRATADRSKDFPTLTGPLNDAAALARHGLVREAVYPFRYALLVVHLGISEQYRREPQAPHPSIGDSNLQELIHDGFCIDEPLHSDCRDHMHVVLKDLGAHISS